MPLPHPPALKGLLLAATILASPLILATPTPAAAQVAVLISVQVAPPALPEYSQPALPAYGYVWTPGYWSWMQAAGYYWVPGTWVLPPVVGLLWTPPYWGWSNGAYILHDGYWGPHVGYYGGVDYGYGYGGHGYEGGRWDYGRFAYNRAVNNFGSVPVPGAYTTNAAVRSASRVSYAGGPGGLTAQPSAEERGAMQDRHVPPTAVQTAHISAAVRTPALAAAHNAGQPPIAATSHPAQFTGTGIVRAQPAVASGEPASGHSAPPHAVVTGPAHPVEQHAVAPIAAAPQVHEQAPQHAAPAPEEHATQRPAEPAAQHPVEQHAAAPHAAPAPHPVEAHVPAPALPSAKPEEERKPGA